jgi:beta-lactamase class D
LEKLSMTAKIAALHTTSRGAAPKPLLVALVLLVATLGPASLCLADVVAVTASDFEGLEQEIGDRDVLFYAIDLASGKHFAYQPQRADERHRPYSTFKIPNLLIAMELGIESGLDHERQWDQAQRPASTFWPSDWREDQTLRTAFRRSAVWYFRDIALEVGGERYRHFLQDIGYGNAEAPDDSDLFWLNGPLMISPKEQTLFLERLLTGQLPIGEAALTALEEASFLTAMSGSTLHGKTGAGPVDADDFDGAFEGWLVGWVRRPENAPLVFALYVRGPNFGSIRDFRRQMSIRILQAIGTL